MRQALKRRHFLVSRPVSATISVRQLFLTIFSRAVSRMAYRLRVFGRAIGFLYASIHRRLRDAHLLGEQIPNACGMIEISVASTSRRDLFRRSQRRHIAAPQRDCTSLAGTSRRWPHAMSLSAIRIIRLFPARRYGPCLDTRQCRNTPRFRLLVIIDVAVFTIGEIKDAANARDQIVDGRHVAYSMRSNIRSA